MPWELLFAYLLERTKSDLATILPEWLEALQVLEAGSSLATFAELNPDYTFPQFAKSDAHSGILSCVEMGHPLLAREECVVNDFKIDGLQHLDLVTGSNMSGKSTFLRTVGINLALANSGGPVHAQAMHVTPLRMYTCIRVADSVNDGISFFYAEVRRLKKMLSELEAESSFPLLYFIDEVFRGTNNRERLIGSRELLQQMSALNGSGMVSTHDLDLTKLADEMAGVTNYHFREHIEGREMHFDYKLHPGPSPTTNALKIMELEGLISENRTPRTVR
jgi:DNA mismatch repair ATPase MutS